VGLIRFVKNIIYLSKYNLKDFHKDKIAIEELKYAVNHIKYEVASDLETVQRFKINSADETLDKLVNTSSSIIRFGDGEINLMAGNSIPFQHADEKLAERLKEALADCSDNLMQGIPLLFASHMGNNIEAIHFTRAFYGKYHNFIVQNLNKDREYYDVSTTYRYIGNGGTDVSFLEDYYNKFISIWKDKDIAVICGDRIFNVIDNNIFDFASSVEYIYAPSTNAFDKYEEIKERALKIDKHKIVIIILGPTATILAYDLFKQGYRALDIGHLAKDYDAYKKKLESTDENVFKFFAKE